MSTTATSKFEFRVRERLLENKLAGRTPDSIRGLARTMAKGDPARAATFKRSLFKWMAAGVPVPSLESRALVAEALGIDRSELDEDDEESDPMEALMGAIRRLVREEHEALTRVVPLPAAEESA